MGIGESIRRVRAENPGKRIDCYLTFASHTDTFEMNGRARDAGFSVRISTTPRDIQASCGVALLVRCEDAAALNGLAVECGIALEKTVPLPCQIDSRRDRYC